MFLIYIFSFTRAVWLNATVDSGSVLTSLQ